MNQPQTETYEENEIDLHLYFQLFWKYKWIALLIISCFIAVTLIYTFWIALEVYEADTTILPLKAEGSVGMSSLKGMVPSGLTQLLPLSEGEDELNRSINILESRTSAETVVRDLNLVDRLYPQVSHEKRPSFQEVVEEVQGDLITVSENQKGLVRLTVQVGQRRWTSPKIRTDSRQLAADIANAYIEQLQRFFKENTATKSRRNRIFIEEQYQKAIRTLEEVELRLQTFEDEHKVFSLPVQIEEMIMRLGIIKGNLMAKEVQMNVLKRSGIGSDNLRYETLTFEIDALNAQIEEMSKGVGNPNRLDSIVLESLPELGMELYQLMRDKRVQETLYTLLVQEYEKAKLTEANDEISFLVLDSATPPFRRLKPRQTLNILLGGILGLLFAAGYTAVQMGQDKRPKRDEITIDNRMDTF